MEGRESQGRCCVYRSKSCQRASCIWGWRGGAAGKIAGQPQRGLKSCPKDSELCLIDERKHFKTSNHHAGSRAKLEIQS